MSVPPGSIPRGRGAALGPLGYSGLSFCFLLKTKQLLTFCTTPEGVRLIYKDARLAFIWGNYHETQKLRAADGSDSADGGSGVGADKFKRPDYFISSSGGGGSKRTDLGATRCGCTGRRIRHHTPVHHAANYGARQFFADSATGELGISIHNDLHDDYADNGAQHTVDSTSVG